jgi:sarcosine oxidase, subunit alpha
VTSSRLPEGGSLIDRSKPLSFVFDDVEYPAFEGDTLASALLANGVNGGFRSPVLGRPRGVMTSGPSEPNAFVEVTHPWFDAIAPATMVKIVDDLRVRSLSGVARLPDPAPAEHRLLHRHARVETLVVGTPEERWGDLGLEFGAGNRALLCVQGGSDSNLFWFGDRHDGSRWLRGLSLLGLYDDAYAVLLERADPADRLWHVRADRVVLATAVQERPIAFAWNDRPGTMLAGSVRRYIERHGVLPGRRAVLFTAHGATDRLVNALTGAGAEVAAVLDVRQGAAVETTDDDRSGAISAVRTTDGRVIECDLLCVSGGFNPDLHLWRSVGGTVRYDEAKACFVPEHGPPWLSVAGFATGEGIPETAPYFAVPSGEKSEQFVDLQRDQTVGDIEAAVDAGLRNVEHIKRATYIGTAVDQGRTSGALAAEIVSALLGAGPGDQGPTTARPPWQPVSFGALAGPYRGRSAIAQVASRDGHRFDPVRVTPIQQWHVDHGAVFENVGQWKRPRFFPSRPDESMDEAVLRECMAARTAVAMMDASTLGKIEVVGADAPEFLDRMYTNSMSSLGIGKIRYGLMLGLDGMAFDDGVAMRLAEDRYLVTTTTGGAARVLDRFEEWLQTEWPSLRVYCTSVTEQWATIAVVGPKARDVLQAAGTDVDVSNEAFPFMTWRDGHIGGLNARLARVSFSGELAIEVNVSGTDGLRAWKALFDAGEEMGGITPYGTEAMHVLRAEKGFVIVGQDTDGTQTPGDLGMSWIVNTRKGDFIGRRSLRRSDMRRPDRKQLVGLLPEDPSALITEGAQLVAEEHADASPPVPLLGHVTSSYVSAALERTFALAMLAGGRNRIGGRIVARSVDRGPIPARVTEPVFYDPQGARRDG